MGNSERGKLNLKQYFTDGELFEKHRLDVAKLLFIEDGWTRDDFHLSLKKMFHGNEQRVNIEALTDEVYEYYLKHCELRRMMEDVDLVKPAAREGFKYLNDKYYKENFGNKN